MNNAILLAIKNGDTGVYRNIVDKNYDRCYNFVFGLINNSEVTEEIIRNALMKLWSTRRLLDLNQTVSHCLEELFRREVYDYLQAHCGTEQIKVQSRIQINKNGRKVEAGLFDVLNTLPAKRRQIFILSRQRQMTSAEIAKELNLSVRTVEKHIELAMKQLRTQKN